MPISGACLYINSNELATNLGKGIAIEVAGLLKAPINPLAMPFHKPLSNFRLSCLREG